MHSERLPCRLPDHVLDRSLSGLNLDAVTLRDLTSGEPTLLLFLRHFG